MLPLSVWPETLSARRACLHERAMHTTNGFGNDDLAGYVADAASAVPLLVTPLAFVFHGKVLTVLVASKISFTAVT